MAAANTVNVADDGADECEAGSTKVTSDAAINAMQAAMAGMSIVSQSSNSSLPSMAGDNLLLAGAAACSTNNVNSAAGAAAATKYAGKKKKTAKKGARKAKQESKSKELVLYDHQTVKCGTLICNTVHCMFLTK